MKTAASYNNNNNKHHQFIALGAVGAVGFAAAATTGYLILSPLPLHASVAANSKRDSVPFPSLPQHLATQLFALRPGNALVAVDTRFLRCIAVIPKRDLFKHGGNHVVLDGVPVSLLLQKNDDTNTNSKFLRFAQLPLGLFFDNNNNEAAAGITTDFTVWEPRLAAVLTDMAGLRHASWQVKVTYYLRYPSGVAVGVKESSSLPVKKEKDEEEEDIIVSASSVTSTVNNFFAAAAAFQPLVLSPEQELNRFIALNCSYGTATTATTATGFTILPPQFRINQILPSLLRECVADFYTAHAQVLGNPAPPPAAGSPINNQHHHPNKPKNNINSKSPQLKPSSSTAEGWVNVGDSPSTAKKNDYFLVRQVAATFADFVRAQMLANLPGRLYAECGVRVSDVEVFRA